MLPLDHHAALIYAMVLVSASNGDMTDAEMTVIGDIVGHLPIFQNYDRDRLSGTLSSFVDTLRHEDGLNEALEAITEALPPKLRDTAYALACDVAAADLSASQAELRILEELRHRLNIDRLTAAAIERGTRARFTVV